MDYGGQHMIYGMAMSNKYPTRKFYPLLSFVKLLTSLSVNLQPGR